MLLAVLLLVVKLNTLLKYSKIFGYQCYHVCSDSPLLNYYPVKEIRKLRLQRTVVSANMKVPML